jgi:hypothetical protein
MALVIVAGASGQHATFVYEAAMLSGLPVAGFATIGDETPAPLLDCHWLGIIRAIGIAEIRRSSTFIVAGGSNALRYQESETLRAQGASFQSVCHPSTRRVTTAHAPMVASASMWSPCRTDAIRPTNMAGPEDSATVVGVPARQISRFPD